MASLNTLRTKFGALLSIIIGGALLAFILSLKADMGFSGNDPEVGVVNGEDVTYTEYMAAYEEVKAQMGGELTTDQQMQQAVTMAWQNIFGERVMTPELAAMGLMPTAAEHKAMLRGERPSNVYGQFFADPSTGLFSIDAVAMFLEQTQTNPQAQYLWGIMSKQAKLDKAISKYVALVQKAAYLNKLQVERSAKGVNEQYSGHYVAARYNTVADSLVTVSDSEALAHYKSHKSLYKQTPYRSIAYVEFEVAATDEDKTNIEAEAKKAAEEFAQAKDIVAFSRENRHVQIAQNYVTLNQLSTTEAAALGKGKFYGPELVTDEWRAARTVDVRNVPDTLSLSHVVLSYTDTALADSLYQAARKGASIADMASKYSIANDTAANGGKLGEIAYSALTPEFADALVGKRKGDVVSVTFGNAIQIVKIDDCHRPSKHYKVASMVYKQLPSQDTKRAVHNAASTFVSAAQQGDFNEAVKAQGLSTRTANIEQAMRSVRGIDGSSIEVVRWANDAKVGEVSDIIKVDDNYIVAVLTSIHADEYKSFEESKQQIVQTMLRDKKFAILREKMQGATLEEIAKACGSSVGEFKDVRLTSYFIPGMGSEPTVMGAMSAIEKGKVSQPIQGVGGAYVVVVDEVTPAEKLQSIDDERVARQAEAEMFAARRALFSVQALADIKDNTVKYF